ncbi:MAG: acetylglutamate kinase [Acidobacteria bacterium]|nr:MAG: acetylglutamate kinase [Acidobacteriota bacterium]
MKLVVKLSGKVLEDRALRLSIAHQVALLWTGGHRLLVVHGAGKQLTDLSRQLGIPVIQHQGRRVTDDRTLDAAKMVFSAVNRDLVALLVSQGTPALGITAYDALLSKSIRRPPLRVADAEGVVREVDFGFVGEISEVNREALRRLVEAPYLPVICSLCAEESGQVLNINADTVATEFAIGLGADRLVSVSDVAGIYLDPKDPTTLISRLSAAEAREYLQQGRFTEGMIPKVETALKAVEHGVTAVQIVSGIERDALVQAIEKDAGTLLTAQ